MLSLGALAFTAPWLLAALLALPLLWWLLRLTPPAPQLIRFPPVRLMTGLRQDEETPARTPLWLVVLRFVLAAIVVLALAHPLLNPRAPLDGSGPLVLVVDTGWAAAPGWDARRRALADLIDRAERGGRAVVLIEGAPPATGAPIRASGPMTPAAARRRADSLVPHPWPNDRAAVRRAVDRLALEGSADVRWLSDGLAVGGEAALAARLQRLGSLRVLRDAPGSQARLLLPPAIDGTALTARIARAEPAGPDAMYLRASAEDGRVILREPVRFAAGQASAELRLDLPGEVRNRIVRLDIDGEASAGAVFLLDERWRRRPVGLLATGTRDRDLPLLGELYYLERALTPFSEVHVGDLATLLAGNLAVIIMPDFGPLPEPDLAGLVAWIENGGVVARFAGPRLAQGADSLTPVELRRGGRTFGGAMSWAQPAHLAPFEASSPFAGLEIPADVTIKRQVLAQPSPELAARTWARLADGTPLVTAERRSAGWLVLFHTTANPDWSDLSLSGLFVEMLRRVVRLSRGVIGDKGTGPLRPVELLDGFGRSTPPPNTAVAIEAEAFADAAAGPGTPPGFYGRGAARRALNLSAGLDALAPIGRLPDGVATAVYGAGRELDLQPLLLALALALGLVDLVLSLALRGLLPSWRGAGAAAFLVLLALPAGGARAGDNFALRATLTTHLAYVETGAAAVDRVSEAGLRGLGEVLGARTAVELGPPMGVDIERDELAFFPLIYWPVEASQPALSATAIKRLDAYLRNGGTVLFDTRDQYAVVSSGSLGGGDTRGPLRRLLKRLNIPPLVPVPADHVLTKAFYLIQQFPGRWAGGALWVEAARAGANDGVSSVLIGSHDWIGAWAINDRGSPIFPVVPGGERQREMAYRFGVNLVMYVLTGNYKADQVHIPAILERLGQ